MRQRTTSVMVSLFLILLMGKMGSAKELRLPEPDPRAVECGLYIQPRPAVQKGTVTFTVTEPSKVARKRCPVRGSIPMFRGELKDPKQIRLLDANGKAIPVQGMATAVWPEGTVKFLCLDFLTDLAPGETKTFTLEYGTDLTATTDTKLTVKKEDKIILVNTGVLEVSFQAGKQFCSAVKVNGQAVTRGPITDRLLVSEGEPTAPPKSYALVVEKVEVVEQGPVQATIYLKGSFGAERSRTPLPHQKNDNFPRYPFHGFVRLYAQSARLDVIHTFGYNGDEHMDFVRRYGLVIPVAAENAKFNYGGDGGALHKAAITGDLQLTQSHHSNWTLAGAAQAQGKRFGGWAAVSKGAASVVAGLRSAWQQWPVSFSANQSGDLIVDIYGGLDDTFLDLRYTKKGVKVNWHTGEGHHKSKSMYTGEKLSSAYGQAVNRAMGLVKISELVLDFTSGVDLAAVGSGFHQRLVPWPDAKRFSDTRVFGLTGFYHDKHPRHQQAKDYYSILLDFPFAAHGANGLYGWVDWPDAPDFEKPKDGKFDTSRFLGGVGWTNGERLTMGYLGHYVASGWRRALDLGVLMVLHNIGIDIEHPGGDQTTGAPHRHNQVHWGGGGGPRQAGWRGWYMAWWLFGHNEVWRSIQELHPVPMGIHDYSGTMAWPYHHEKHPREWYIQKKDTSVLVMGSNGTPFHYMNLMRWHTTSDKEFVRFMDLLMRFWSKNPYLNNQIVSPDTGKTIQAGRKRPVRQFRVRLEDDTMMNADKLNYDPPNPDDPPRPYCLAYYFNTYGGVSLISEWAQLTGSKAAVDVIQLIGDYHAVEQRGTGRVDIANSDKRQSANPWQIYNALDGLGPAYFLLRQKSHPARAQHWKKAMEWRAYDYVWGSPRRMTKGAKPLEDPYGYTADGWHAMRVWCYGKNGPKIFAAAAMTSTYTLWFSRPEGEPTNPQWKMLE